MTGRFAPSPTGPLHVGNLRTALLAWLVARAAGEPFLVRMEDLDRVTSSVDHEAGQLARPGRDRRRLGRRGRAPERALRPLRRGDRRADGGRADVRVLLHAARDPGGGERAARARAGLPRDVPRPDGGASARPPARERPAALRLRAPAERGHRRSTCSPARTRRVPDDVVLRRNDGVPAYNLAVVVDDAAQGVEHGRARRRPAGVDAAPGPAAAPARPADAALRPRPARRRRRRRAARQAPRRGHARRPRRAPPDASSGVALLASLGADRRSTRSTASTSAARRRSRPGSPVALADLQRSWS